jgi:hypothetical protein
MKNYSLAIILLTLLWSCNCESQEPWCYSCDNESVVETCYDVHAKVVAFWHDPINGQETTYGLTIRKEDMFIDGYIIEPDSCLIPCPPLSGNFRKLGLHVTISYRLKNCESYLTSPDLAGQVYGRKIEIINIKHY